MNIITRLLEQARKPTGHLGRWMTRFMNVEHSRMTDWALTHVFVGNGSKVLDVGCGGGRTVQKLAGMTTVSKVFGIDLSEESVAISRKTNGQLIGSGRVEIIHGTVSRLPFAENVFDLVTAVETYYFWPDLVTDLREIARVLKPGGQLAIMAEAYKGGGSNDKRFQQILRLAPQEGTMNYLSAGELGEAFSRAGLGRIQVFTEEKKGWVCAIGCKQ
jgi:ubiquinone/menaquinone biosynthesis C-methylase UbiE